MTTNIPLLINGQEEHTPSTFSVISPYTNEQCWTSSSATPQDAIRAVEAADAAFPAWSQTKPTTRRDLLLKAADLLEQRLEQNAEYMRTEMGADVGASQGFVVPLAIRMLRDVAGRITSICGSVPVVEAEGQRAMVLKEAMGVILGIVPWNAPYVFGIRSAACALAAGNTTILKSSELTPRCYWAIGRAFEDAGLPAGCLNIIHCRPTDAADVVNAMIEHPAVRKINFTGSTAVGRKIARSCGQNLKPCLMELGGKNSSIVCQDADLDTAVQGVLAGAFLNTLLTNALASGAHFISGSTPADVDATLPSGCGVRMAPAILGGVSEDMPVWQEEAFASVAACMTFDSEEEAVRLANGSGYGLSASVFTEDLRRGFALARRIQSG
ncbi:unnamed protein product [Penicillium manginii]